MGLGLGYGLGDGGEKSTDEVWVEERNPRMMMFGLSLPETPSRLGPDSTSLWSSLGFKTLIFQLVFENLLYSEPQVMYNMPTSIDSIGEGPLIQ